MTPVPKGRTVRIQLHGRSRIAITGRCTKSDHQVAVVGGQVIPRRNIASWSISYPVGIERESA